MKKLSKLLKISLLGLTLWLGFSAFNTSEKYFEIAKNLDIFATLFKEVNAYYVDEVNPSKMMGDGIFSMLDKLDPYTNYIPEDRIEDYRTQTTGQYGGVGATIDIIRGKVVVTMPFEDSPAQRADLRIGDEVLEINGISTEGKENTEMITKLLKGQAGTSIKLKVKRFGTAAPLEIELTREKIHIDNVTYFGMVSEDIGMIKLTDFTMDASKEVRNALVTLKEKGASKIILDLRGNPGGLLNEAVNISNIFVPKGSEIVSTRGKVKDWNKTYKALNPAIDTEIPLVVLVSSGSASASEIVAGVMQDYDRGVLIGENSFGKGLVQTTRPLTYNAQVKITVAKYYTPSGRCIQAIDYSNRNPDGSVGKVPDSLRAEFETTNGRVVYDGGGVKPDIEIADSEFAPITKSLFSKGLLFAYATEFHSKNEKIASAKQFQLSDVQYQDFVNWLKGKEYDYKTAVDKSLKKLEENAEKEGRYAELQAQIEALKQRLTHNKEKDLTTHKAQIQEMLEYEIVTRYYLQKGGVEASFDDDPDILESIKVLNDKARYAKILAGK